MVPIITLLTDFGIKDGYVGSLKGIMLGICPEARLIDISHLVPPQDVRAAAYLLASHYRDFPTGTIHLAVIDPGVGSERRALAIRTSHYFFVGPDNGLFSWILEEQSGARIVSLENRQFWRSAVSMTFHGRDIFAPVAAHLAKGIDIDEFGPPCTPARVQWDPVKRSKEALTGEVIYIDHFGNAITNVTHSDLQGAGKPENITIQIGPHRIDAFVDTYSDASHSTAVALIGSSGHLEIAVNQGNAAELLNIRAGVLVIIHLS